jgi:sterol desaturase/sphingolipid hydroxylase (fatty acid hydroxylase superfamily)
VTKAMLETEPVVRLAFFFVILIAVSIGEALIPRRKRNLTRLTRWPGNLGIVALNTLMLRILFPITAIGVALLSEERAWGVLNAFAIPEWIRILIALVVLDLAIYLQHVLFHAVPVLWRLHRMHHADLDFDVTTGVRFHPIEIMLSLGIKLAVVVALGAPPLAVLVFEVLLNATSLFNHGNLNIPRSLDKVLRWIVVTPDMHRVHHSWHPDETNSNFGFNLPWWDRLLGTYKAQPRDGHKGMTIGIDLFREPAWERLDRMLIQPFVGPAHTYPINAHKPPDRAAVEEPLRKNEGKQS